MNASSASTEYASEIGFSPASSSAFLSVGIVVLILFRGGASSHIVAGGPQRIQLTTTTYSCDADLALRASAPPRPVSGPPRLLRLLLLVVVLVTVGGAHAWAALGGGAQIEDIETSLVHDPSYKVRVEAALVLGRLHQIRSIPVLISAQGFEHSRARPRCARSGSSAHRSAVTPSPLPSTTARTWCGRWRATRYAGSTLGTARASSARPPFARAPSPSRRSRSSRSAIPVTTPGRRCAATSATC